MEDDTHTQEELGEQGELVDLDEIMRAFGIAQWKNLGPAESTYSDQLRLLVEFNGQRYVLKERAGVLVAEEPNHRYDFQHYLQQQGIPIPDLWRTPSGEPMVVVGEDFFELQQAVAGEQFSTNDERALAWVGHAGSMLGRIHQASLHYPGKEFRWPSEVHLGALVQGLLNLARSKAEQSEIQAIAAALSDWVDAWEAVLPAAMMSIGSVHTIPEFHIHGDYHALNLRFGPFGVTAVTGLEAARWERRIFEVAYGLFYFCALRWQPDSSVTRPLTKRGFEPELARHFLAAYGEVYPPARGEAALLADALMLVSPITTFNGPLEDLFYLREGVDETLIDDMLERLNWATTLPAWLNRVRKTLPEMWE